jgi:trimeric autotransporter adhesin
MRRLISIILLLSASWTVDGQITVGGSTSSILSLNSTSQGVLTPRMSKVDRLGIISPAIGLLVYQTDEVAGFYFYGGQGWKSLNASAISIQDVDQDSKVQVEETPDDDIVRIDLGGTEVVTFKNNNFSGSRIEFPANNGNVFMGNLSGRLAIGTDNLLIGDSVGYTNIGGSFNLGLGTKSLFANLNGQANLAIGKHALLSSVADSNMAIGIHALTSNTTGKLNTAIGYNALTQNTVGNTNTAIGYSLYRNQTGSANTVIGYEAMSDNTTGSDNTVIGDYGSHRSTSASSNTIVNDASSTETMLNNLDGSENAIAGTRIIRDGTSISQTTAMGHDVMRFMTGGINNLAIGNKAMFGNNTGDSNVGIGNEAMSVFDAGTKNTIIGQGTEFSSVQDGHNITAVYIDTTGTEFENMNGTIIGFENSEGGGPNHTIIGQGISLPSYTGHHSHTVIGSLDIYPVVSNVITLGGINSRVGIGTTNPHPSAIMDVKSTTKGMLFPRIDKESINPGGRTDLLIYDSIRNAFYKSVDEPGQWRWHNLKESKT